MKIEKIKQANFEYLLGGILIFLLSAAIAREYEVLGDTRRLFLEPLLWILLFLSVWPCLTRSNRFAILSPRILPRQQRFNGSQNIVAATR